MTHEKLEKKARIAAFDVYHVSMVDGRDGDAWLDAALDKYRTILSEGIGFTKPAQEEQQPEQPTLRDQFAMAALQGQLARQPAGGWLNLAEFCYIMADAMLAARKTEGSK